MGEARGRDRAAALRRASARRRMRRGAVRRRRLIALLVIVAAVVIPLAAIASSTPKATRTPLRPTASRRRGVASASARGGRTVGARTSVGTHSAATRTTPSPGSLPQTHAYPSATSSQFKALMADLWSGVVHDSLTRALPAFFPEKAYVQLKAISDAAGDWSGRLVHDFGLDLTAAHQLLGRDAAHARLVGVDAVSSYGHWIDPSVCDNSIGYYEMPNARMIYREDGEVRSFGIASMISWRGIWYLVHFGAILRATDSGQVDDPAVGAGVSAYSGTC